MTQEEHDQLKHMASQPFVPVETVLDYLKNRNCPTAENLHKHLGSLRDYFISHNTGDIVPVMIDDEFVHVALGPYGDAP